MRKFLRILYHGIRFDLSSHRKIQNGEWTEPAPTGGYQIPAFDPTMPKGVVSYGPDGVVSYGPEVTDMD